MRHGAPASVRPPRSQKIGRRAAADGRDGAPAPPTGVGPDDPFQGGSMRLTRPRFPPPARDCGGAIQRTRVAPQYQEDLPVVRPIVRRFDVHIGGCVACGRRVQGRHQAHS